ncbi:MAG: HopJ type III effector protein [Pseudomonadales bacterium]|nr:HopJ type III effector protein [Pseudomonadales bacterium]
MNKKQAIDELLQLIRTSPESVSFTQVIEIIDTCFHFTPKPFINGTVNNPAGENQGACKIFAFAQDYRLDQEQTLACFGDYYRIDVLQRPEGKDHANIRQFMKSGPSGVLFHEGSPLRNRHQGI